jgi:hypothetical protein
MPSLSLDERIAKEKQKLKQLENEKRAKEAREKHKQKKIDDRRKIIAGAILLNYFPNYKTLNPTGSNAECEKEFAPLADFLACLAENKAWVSQLEIQAQQKAQKRLYSPPNEQQSISLHPAENDGV